MRVCVQRRHFKSRPRVSGRGRSFSRQLFPDSDPYHMHRAHRLGFHLFPALMRNPCLSSALLSETCGAASHPAPSSHPLGEGRASFSLFFFFPLTKTDQLHNRCHFFSLCLVLLHVPLFPGADIKPLFCECEEEEKKKKKKPSYYGDDVRMVQPGCLI